MNRGLTDIINQGIASVGSPSATVAKPDEANNTGKSDETVKTDADNNVSESDSKASELKPDEANNTGKSDETVKTESKSKGVDAAIARKHAQFMSEKERADKAEQRTRDLELQLSTKSTATDTPVEDLDDLHEKVKNEYVHKDDINEYVKSVMQKETESANHAKAMQDMSVKRDSFAVAIFDKYHSHVDKNTGEYPQKVIDEVQFLNNFFISQPDFWLGYIEKNGLDGMLSALNGSIKSKAKVEVIDQIMKDNNRAAMETKGDSSVKDIKDQIDVKKASIGDILRSGMAKLKK